MDPKGLLLLWVHFQDSNLLFESLLVLGMLPNLIAGYSVIVLCFHKKFGVTTSGKTSFGDYLHMLVNQAFIFRFAWSHSFML